jgi:hypothetical protein
MDCFAPLEAASLRDFHVRAASAFNFQIAFGDLGELFGSATNLEIRHGEPGTQRPYEVFSAGIFNFREIPNRLGGTADYRITEPLCSLLNRPCQDTIPLANQPTTPIGEFAGTLTLSNGILRLAGSFDFGPVSVATGSTLSGVATITAIGVLQPCLRIEQGPFLVDHSVSWSTAFGDFRLMRAEALSPTAQWQEAIPAFGWDDGAITNAVFENLPGTMYFYRLESQTSSSARSR